MDEGLLHRHAAPFRFEAAGTVAAVLFHGWTGSPAHLRPLGAKLQVNGITASAPLLAGHGTVEADMLATGWRDWLRSAGEAVGIEAAVATDLHLVGLSMGGLLALLIAPTFGAASVTTINAPIKVWDRTARFSWLVRGSNRMRDHGPELPPDGDVAEYYQQYERSPLGTAADLFDLVRASRANLDRVTCPTLIIQSRADETVRPESATIIHDRVSAVRKRIVWLESARHMSLLDPERAVIHREVLSHILTGR